MNWQATTQRVRSFIVAPRFQRGVMIVVTALVGAWLGLLIGGSVPAPVGPVETRMSVHPNLYGNTKVDVAPLGDLRFDSHDGPLHLDVAVERLNPAAAESIVQNPSSVQGLRGEVTSEVRSGVVRLIIKAFIVAVLGALLAGLVVWRRQWRRVLLTGAVGAGLMIASLGVAAATWRPRSITEPKFSGLLASAPTVIGDARRIVSDFGRYGDELAKLVTNVSQLYAVGSNLPDYEPDPETVRVLFVSDLHLNPTAWDVIRSLIAQHEINMVIDAGDLTDHGSRPEDRFARPIGSLGVPYVYVRGNHDSLGTEAAVRAQPNAHVLSGEVVDIDGFRIIGAGDPRFTPNRLVDADEAAVAKVGQDLARTAFMSSTSIDIAVVHDPTAVRELDGSVPLLLAGHTHQRSTEILEHGSRLFIQGSTGGAGLRGIETDEPTPITCSILYFDKVTKRLQAWDDITIGGLGQAFATIDRHLVDQVEAGAVPSPRPSPGGAAPRN
jgi:predicted phosphodiesterase